MYGRVYHLDFVFRMSLQTWDLGSYHVLRECEDVLMMGDCHMHNGRHVALQIL